MGDQPAGALQHQYRANVAGALYTALNTATGEILAKTANRHTSDQFVEFLAQVAAPEQHLSQDFRLQGAGLFGETADEPKIYFLKQHYRMPTRLLDWTHNPLAALDFAASEKENADGKLSVMDAYQLGPCQSAQWLNGRAFEGIATSRSPLFKRAISPIF